MYKTSRNVFTSVFGDHVYNKSHVHMMTYDTLSHRIWCYILCIHEFILHYPHSYWVSSLCLELSHVLGMNCSWQYHYLTRKLPTAIRRQANWQSLERCPLGRNTWGALERRTQGFGCRGQGKNLPSRTWCVSRLQKEVWTHGRASSFDITGNRV